MQRATLAVGAVVFRWRRQCLAFLAQCPPTDILVSVGDRIGEDREGYEPWRVAVLLLSEVAAISLPQPHQDGRPTIASFDGAPAGTAHDCKPPGRCFVRCEQAAVQ